VRELEAAGVPRDDISIVASIVGNWYSDKGRGDARTRGVDRYADGTDDRAEGAGAGAGIGAAIGSAAGLLAGLGLLAIPGLGAVVAAGCSPRPRPARPQAPQLASSWARSRRLVSTMAKRTSTPKACVAAARWCRRASQTPTTRATEAMLDRSSVNIADRGAAYRKGGWQQFDPKAKPLTADEVRREREMYRSSAA